MRPFKSEILGVRKSNCKEEKQIAIFSRKL